LLVETGEALSQNVLEVEKEREYQDLPATTLLAANFAVRN
jgi:hypothetical protein